MKYTNILGSTYKLLKNPGSDKDSLMSVDNRSTDANSDSKVVNKVILILYALLERNIINVKDAS